MIKVVIDIFELHYEDDVVIGVFLVVRQLRFKIIVIRIVFVYASDRLALVEVLLPFDFFSLLIEIFHILHVAIRLLDCQPNRKLGDRQLAKGFLLKVVELELERAVSVLFEIVDVLELASALLEQTFARLKKYNAHLVVEERIQVVEVHLVDRFKLLS